MDGNCLLCGAATKLPYTCRPCWTALPLALRARLYRHLEADRHVGERIAIWIRRELRRTG